MLYSEFYERTGVAVDATEYAAIEEIYYNFPGNKDEFCDAWCKMNAKRVKAAKDARKAAEKKAKQEERLMVIMTRMDNKIIALRYDYSIIPLSVNFLSVRDQQFLESLGISLQITLQQAREYGYQLPRHFRIDETAWEIRKYLKLK